MSHDINSGEEPEETGEIIVFPSDKPNLYDNTPKADPESPREMLEVALEEEDFDEFNKGLLVSLNDTGEYYITRYRCAGMEYPDLITVIEALKAHLLKEMGYG